MDNFVFSDELELSIIEHRLINLLEQLINIGQDIFFPAIIYNETFWRLPLQKRLAILQNNQIDWVGDRPINTSFFYVDEFYIDLIKSVKITSFSYTRVGIEILIDTFKTKNKFAITDYQSFGEINNNNILFFNDLLLSLSTKKDDSQKALLGKILAIKFYSKFYNKPSLKCLSLIYNFDQILWINFLSSLKKILKKQNSQLLYKTTFSFGFLSETALKTFESKLLANTSLQKDLEEIDFTYDIVNFDDLKFKQSFDFILLDEIFSIIPTDIITQYGHDFYKAFNRLTFRQRLDEKYAIEKIAELNSPSKEKNVNPDDLANISIEITWEKFQNQQLIDLVMSNKQVLEREFFRVSVSLLKLLVTLVKSLNTGGLIQAFDYIDNGESKYSYGFFTDNDELTRMPFDRELYLKILGSFNDLSFEYDFKTVNELVSKEIYDGKNKIVKVTDLMNFMIQNVEKGRELLDLENFTFRDELRKLTSKFSIYQFLAKKNIMTFGLTSLLYNAGLTKFSNILKTHPMFSQILKNTRITKKNGESYEKDFMANYLQHVIMILSKNGNLFFTIDKNQKQNEEFIKLIESLNFDKDKLYMYLEKYWTEILEISEKLPSNFQSLEIVRR